MLLDHLLVERRLANREVHRRLTGIHVVVLLMLVYDLVQLVLRISSHLDYVVE